MRIQASKSIVSTFWVQIRFSCFGANFEKVDGVFQSILKLNTKCYFCQSVWSDAWAKVGHIHGKLRKWWRLLPLLILSCPRLRQDCPSRHLRSRLPTHCWGPSLWTAPAAEEDQQAQGLPPLVDQVNALCLLVWLCVCGKNNRIGSSYLSELLILREKYILRS